MAGGAEARGVGVLPGVLKQRLLQLLVRAVLVRAVTAAGGVAGAKAAAARSASQEGTAEHLSVPGERIARRGLVAVVAKMLAELKEAAGECAENSSTTADCSGNAEHRQQLTVECNGCALTAAHESTQVALLTC